MLIPVRNNNQQAGHRLHMIEGSNKYTDMSNKNKNLLEVTNKVYRKAYRNAREAFYATFKQPNGTINRNNMRQQLKNAGKADRDAAEKAANAYVRNILNSRIKAFLPAINNLPENVKTKILKEITNSYNSLLNKAGYRKYGGPRFLKSVY